MSESISAREKQNIARAEKKLRKERDEEEEIEAKQAATMKSYAESSRLTAEAAALELKEKRQLVGAEAQLEKSKLEAKQYADELEAKQQQLRAIFGEYLAGEDPFPERVHVNVVCYRLIWDSTEAAASWAAWAIDLVERWPDTASPVDRAQLMRVLEDLQPSA